MFSRSKVGLPCDMATDHFQVVIVGDTGVGKTELLNSIRKRAALLEPPKMPEVGEHVDVEKDYRYPFLNAPLNQFVIKREIEGKVYEVTLTDTSGNDRFVTLRRPYYIEADVFMICFNLDDHRSFQSAVEKWIPEVRHYGPRNAQIILIGTKYDAALEGSAVKYRDVITSAEGLGVYDYVETSALLGINISNVVDAGVTAAISKSHSNKRNNIIDDPIVKKKWGMQTFLRLREEIENDQLPWRKCKLMIIGQGRAGKTSLVRSLLGEPFQSNLESTVGASLEQINTDISNKLWSKSKQRLTHTTQLAVRSVQKRIVDMGLSPKSIPSITKSTTSPIIRTIKSITSTHVSQSFRKKSNTNAQPTFPTEIETEEENQSQFLFDENEVVKELSREVVLTSKTGGDIQDPLSFTIWDYGGQRVFYTLHHLFLTRYGVYIMVFDMRLAVERKEESLEYMKFWLASVSLHAPSAPIIAVGTHCDDVNSSKQRQYINSLFSECLGVKANYPQLCKIDNLSYLPVENKSGRNIEKLRTIIESIAESQAFVQHKVSLRWAKVLDDIMKSRESWLDLETVREIGKRYNVVEDIDSMLELFHELGVLIHLTATEALRNIVIIRPQWLISKLGMVIRDVHLHGYDFNNDEIENVGLKDDLDVHFNDGLISGMLLEHLWKGEQLEFLLDLMKRTLLLSDWMFGSKERKDELYLIPSMVKEKFVVVPIGPRCMIDFESGLPEGIFQRLVCLAVGHSSRLKGSREPVLSKQSAAIWFGKDVQVFLEQECRRDTITWKTVNAFDQDQAASTTSTSHCLRVISSMLFKINEDVMCGGLNWEIRFEVEGGKIIDYATAEMQQLAPWFSNVESLAITNSNTSYKHASLGKSQSRWHSHAAQFSKELESFLDNV